MESMEANLFEAEANEEECELIYGEEAVVVYLLKMDTGLIKIGVTGNIKKRITAIEHASGCFVLEGYHTKKFYNPVAREIESLMHERFAQYRKVGEYFFVTLDDARTKLAHYSELTHFTPKRGKVAQFQAGMGRNTFVSEFLDTGEKFVRVKGATVKAKDFIDALKLAYPDECSKFKKADLRQFICEVGGVECTVGRSNCRVFKGIGKLGDDFDDGEPLAQDDYPF